MARLANSLALDLGQSHDYRVSIPEELVLCRLLAHVLESGIRVMVQGNDGKVYPELHEKYGPIVRIGPRDLSVASEGAQGWKDLYGFKYVHRHEDSNRAVALLTEGT